MALRLKGSTSGSVELDVPAAVSGGDVTLTLPNGTGSANQFLKNGSAAGTLEYSSIIEDGSGNITATGTAEFGGVLSVNRTNSGDGCFHAKLNGTTKASIASDGNATFNRLLVGTSTAGIVSGDDLTLEDSENAGLTIRSGSAYSGSVLFSDGTSGTAEYAGMVQYTHNDGSNSDYMRFLTAATERMRIDNTGKTILLGTSTNGTLVAETTQGAASNKNIIVGGHSASSIDGGTGCFVVLSNGNVVNTNNSYGALSDVKLKENIADASSQWDDIKGIQVRNYNLKESTGQQTHTQLGVVAQEVETVSPGLVSESPDLDADGNDLGTVTKSVNYSVLYMKAVKALQEAMTRIETLETQNTAQQIQIDDLLARVTTLEAS